SITTVDLNGIARIESVFLIVLASIGVALYAGVTLAERRQEFATMAVLGWLLAEMLVAMLQHVFDPPPDHLTVPWGFLGSLAAAAIGGAILAAVAATRSIPHLKIGAILR